MLEHPLFELEDLFKVPHDCRKSYERGCSVLFNVSKHTMVVLVVALPSTSVDDFVFGTSGMRTRTHAPQACGLKSSHITNQTFA